MVSSQWLRCTIGIYHKLFKQNMAAGLVRRFKIYSLITQGKRPKGTITVAFFQKRSQCILGLSGGTKNVTSNARDIKNKHDDCQYQVSAR